MGQFARWTQGLFAAVMIAGLAACGSGSDADAPIEVVEDNAVPERSRRDQLAIERRERLRQEAAAENEADFSYLRYRIDTGGDQPLACFVFSSALEPETDYAPFIDFRPAFRPALSVNGRELCVGGLSFGDERTAILKSGLPSADGRALDRTEEAPIDFADRPPYVGFKGAGVILPRDETDGLPIETVNVDEVRITVSRVDDRALVFKRITQGETTAEGRYSYVYGDNNPSDVEEQLWTGLMAVDKIANAPVVSVFPLQEVVGDLEPGSYYVRVEDTKTRAASAGPPASAQRWIMLTDLALTAYRGEHGLDITVRSLRDGAPVSGVRVELLAQNNDILAEAEAGSDGRVSFDKPITAGRGNTAPKLILAYGAAGDLAALDLTRAPVDLSENAVGGRATPGPVDGYVFTERGIYRPGETVHLTAMLRNREGEAVANRTGTLIVYRPNGMVAERIRFEDTTVGTVVTQIALPRSASRGSWRAVAEIDGLGAVGTARFSVEDFVPQRIAVDLETDDDTPIRAGEARDVEVDARVLYGAPGAGRIVESQARIEPDPAPFEGFEGFRFGRHDATFRERLIELPDQTADGAGKALVRFSPEGRAEDSDRPLRIIGVVNVLEPGGRAVAESVRVPYRPRDVYVGVKPAFDGRAAEGEPAIFEVAAINAAGEAVAARLEWKMLSVNYHYDWYREGEQWRWRRSRSVATVGEGVLPTQAGATSEISVDGLDWGDHELIVTGPDDVSTSRTFWVGWGGSVSEDGVEAPDRVRVNVSDDVVRPGRDVQLDIVPPYDGDAQIVVATDRVISVENRPVSADGTRLSLPVTDDWGEGAYVMVTVYTERDPVLDAKPRRAVGVNYVPVDMERRTFDLTIDAPDVARPRREQLIEVDVDGGPGERVHVTLAAVDEGILQLTKYKSPDPVDYFFGRKALGVSLYDDYGRLLDPNLGAPAEIRSGGDQLGGEGLTVVPTKTVALYSGAVDIGRSGEAKIRFDVPDFNGELRLMAVAWSQSGLGAADSAMTVRDEAPAELILPRFMAPGDEAVATVSIDNIELGDGDFEATLTAAGPIEAATSKATRSLPTGQRADLPIRLESDDTGISRLRLNVDGPGNFSVEHQYLIETRSPYLPITQVDTELMEPGETYSLSPDLLEGLTPGSTHVTVTFSNLPVDAGALYASLAQYPYGCTEQTVSRALPLIYAEQLVAMGADGEQDDARGQVQDAVTRILARQGSDGAFGLWREGDRSASPWLGAYTTDFILRAKQEGYSVPDEALDRAYGALAAIAEGDAWRVYGYDTDVWESRWHADTEQKLMRRAQPFALYVLAKAGEADISRLRYLHDRALGDMESPLAKAHLAAALAHMGDKARATSAFDAAVSSIGYTNSGDYYQTSLRDMAGILALAAETDFNDVAAGLAETLGLDAPDPSRLTTQEKAFLLQAVNGLTKGEADVFTIETTGLGRNTDNDRRYYLSENQVSEDVTFTLGGSAPVFRTVMVQGAPENAPPEAASRLNVDKRVRTLSGGPVSLGNVTQGDQLVISVRLDPEERRVNPIIVADLLPAGFEIETVLRPADGARANSDDGAFAWLGEIASAKTAEARDDRFVAAVDLVEDAKTLAYVVRAVTPGDFAMPGATAEDMYRPGVFARSQPGRVSISPRSGSTAGQP
ncbi:MAG: alpha-2-macroglobulin [Pseudomonadota bacterium]